MLINTPNFISQLQIIDASKFWYGKWIWINLKQLSNTWLTILTIEHACANTKQEEALMGEI